MILRDNTDEYHQEIRFALLSNLSKAKTPVLPLLNLTF